MTQPFQPGQVAAAYQTSATPQSVADRVDQLQQTHSWMPADMQTTLATSQTSDTEMHSIADEIKQTLASSWNGFTEAFHDPVLDKQPTAELALTRYLTSAVGPLPVAQVDLRTIQANLQKQGYGKDLSVNGVWGSDWNAVYNDWASTARAQQLAGNRPGSVGTAKAAHHWYDAMIPSHAINAIGGYVESLPGAGRDLVANVVGSAVNAVTDPQSYGHESKAHQEASAGAGAARAIQSLLGNPNAAEHVHQQIEHPIASTFQDAQTLLAVAPVARAGSAAAKAAAGEWAGGITMDAAQRGPGVIAKSLFGGVGRRDLGLEGNVLSGDTAAAVARGAERDALRRGPLNSRVFQNIPLLQQVGPVVGRLADADGAYYKLRTLLAAPYALPAVRAAGEIGQRTMLTGGAIHGAAQLENAVGLGNAQSNTVLNARPLDTIDLSLQRITGTPYAHPFSRAVDSLGFILHGPLGSTAAPEAIGRSVDHLNDVFSDVLGKVDIRGWWERAASDATGKTVKIKDIQKAFGDPEYLDRFMQMKIADLAAAHYAQDAAQKEGLAFGASGDAGLAYRKRVGELADQVWKSENSDLHVDAIQGLLAHDQGVGFKNRIAADMVHNNLDPQLYHDDLLEAIDGKANLDSYARNAKAWMQSGGHLTDVFQQGGGKFMFGPNGRAVIHNSQDDFDFGLGQDSPVRLLSTTRRDYVRQVNESLTRVRRQVNDARAQAGKVVADLEGQVGKPEAEARYAGATTTEGPQVPGELAARLDENGKPVKQPTVARSLQLARQRQQALEKAYEAGDMRTFGQLAKKIVPATRKAPSQWDRLSKESARLRALVDQGSNPDERLTLQHILENGVNPDDLYTNINGEPIIPPSAGVTSGDLAREHVNVENGAVGVGKISTKSAQQAAGDVNRFRAKLEAATTDEERAAVVERMKNYAFVHFGMTERTLGVFDGRPQALADRLDEQAHTLASELMLTYDTPQWVHDKIAAMKELGYRPMIGSHIGHLWDGSLPPMPELGGAVGFRRKVASAIGVTPEQVSPRSAGQDAAIRVLREIGDVMHDPKATVPARTTAETVMQVLRDENLLQPDMKSIEKGVLGLTSRFHRKGIEQLQKERGLESFGQAEQEYKSEMARSLYLQPRDVPRKKFIAALTTPGEGKNGAGTWQWAGMDQRTANLVYRAVLRGYADRPGYIMGMGAIEDWVRGGFWIGDKLATTLPTSEMAQRVAALPNSLIVNRNRLRFTLSPFFDFRRIVKQNYKMSNDTTAGGGVVPVMDPLGHMINNGTFEQAHKFLSKLVGEPQFEGFDEADRYLHSQSVWGLYNTRHYEAYYAWEKKMQGATDDQVREGIRRVFEYGSATKGGRSALERTMNTMFFPFSFEKTLIRNTGAYMLSHPQQALLLTGAMVAYDDANKNGQITQWTQDHLPILRDMQKMNAFAHGISPGERGGINAPLLNLFLPQTYSNANLTKKNLARNLPVWKDFSQVLSDSLQQTRIVKNAALNTIDYATSGFAPRGAFDPYRPTITTEAQTRHAEAMRSKYITALAPVLEQNASTSDPADKITFPNDPRIPWRVRGVAVDRTSIGELMKTWYPAYDPGSAAKYAQDQQRQLDEQIQKIAATNPEKAKEYKAFQNVADKIQGHLNRGDYDTPDAASLMMTLRSIAVGLSEQDPTFFKMFTSHYKFAFGPLTEVPG